MPTVLVVDDSAFMRRRGVALVKELGYETVEASDGQQALVAYERTRPEAVLMDITMPNTDGLEALGQIMAIDPSAKVVMVSAINQRGATMEAMQAGARAFVVKPFQRDELKGVLQKLLD